MQLGFAPLKLKKKLPYSTLQSKTVHKGTRRKKHTNKPLLDEKKRYSHCRTRRDCGGEERKKKTIFSWRWTICHGAATCRWGPCFYFLALISSADWFVFLRINAHTHNLSLHAERRCSVFKELFKDWDSKKIRVSLYGRVWVDREKETVTRRASWRKDHTGKIIIKNYIELGVALLTTRDI